MDRNKDLNQLEVSIAGAGTQNCSNIFGGFLSGAPT